MARKLNCVDQFEDGTPDPGFDAQYSGSAFAVDLACSAVSEGRVGRGSKDAINNFVIAGYADNVAPKWGAHTWTIYDILKSVDSDYRGFDVAGLKVKANPGARGRIRPPTELSSSDRRPPTPFSPEGSSVGFCAGNRYHAICADSDLR